jgi:Asp/Glu/hydantoin racemase
MREPIVVINPNSTEAVTAGISAALEPLRMAGGPEIECLTLAEGPPGVETQADVEGVVEPLCQLIRQRDNEAGAFVIACFSDPGLHLARESTARPVFGIAECAMVTALTLGERFGVISILEGAIPRHLRYVRSLGLWSRFAGDLAVGLGVVEFEGHEGALARMTEVGGRLRDEHGADVAIMGCAGMAGLKRPLQEALGIPVVEPCQAAVTMALGAARLVDS